MAGKEATVFICDVGQSMGAVRPGREVSDLDYSLQYVWDKIAAIVGSVFTLRLICIDNNQVATERKTLAVGVVALRTDGESLIVISYCIRSRTKR